MAEADSSAAEKYESILFEPYFELLHQRWTYVQDFLPNGQADQMLELAKQLPLKAVDSKYKRAEQNFARFGLRLDDKVATNLEWLLSLGRQTEDFIHSGRFVDQAFASFNALEAAVQRYGRYGKLTGHRDLESNPIAIAIISLGDDAYLDILAEDRQTILNTIVLRHGDLAVLGARGLGNGERPMHGLRVPESADDSYERISITYRGAHEPVTNIGYGNV